MPGLKASKRSVSKALRASVKQTRKKRGKIHQRVKDQGADKSSAWPSVISYLSGQQTVTSPEYKMGDRMKTRKHSKRSKRQDRIRSNLKVNQNKNIKEYYLALI